MVIIYIMMQQHHFINLHIFNSNNILMYPYPIQCYFNYVTLVLLAQLSCLQQAELIGWVVVPSVVCPSIVRPQLHFHLFLQNLVARLSSDLVGMYLGWVSTRFVQMVMLRCFLARLTCHSAIKKAFVIPFVHRPSLSLLVGLVSRS